MTSALFDWHRRGNCALHGFSFAGSGAGALKGVAAHVPDGIGFAEHLMPGRGRRHREPVATTLPQVCEQAAAALCEAPDDALLFGYSLGALMAYETALRLQALGRPPRAMIVCAMNAPHRLAPAAEVHRMSLPALRAHLERLGGTPREVLDDLDVLACFAPAIQADYRLIETYRPHGAPLLRCPIVALAGTRDTLVHGPDVAAWATLTTGRFDALWIDAPHFFLHTHPNAWRQTLRHALSVATRPCLAPFE